jgi:hypothetical protein
MATRLYFHDATNTQSGTYPSGRQGSTGFASGATDISGSGTLKKMNSSIGSSQVNQGFSSAANQNIQKFFMRFWVSPPLDGNQTVGAGSYVLNYAHAESNTNMNLFTAGTYIYVWRPSTGSIVGEVKSTLVSGVIPGTEPGAASSERVWHQSGIGSSAVSALDGDVIIIELYWQFTQGMSTSYTGTIYYDGTTANTTDNAVVSNHASFIEFAENLVFKSFNKKGEFFKIID